MRLFGLKAIFCYTEIVGNINQAFMLAKKKLSEKDVDEIEIVKVKEQD